MAFSVSPSVTVSEIDATGVVAAVSTTEAGYAGVFRWGPIEQRTLVSSEADLVRIFGKPTNLNPETFFTGAQFLAYGNALHVVRTAETTNANTSLNVVSAYSNTANVTVAPAVKNYSDFETSVLDSALFYVAKYPGAMGSSLKVSQCDSANAFGSTLTITDAGVTGTAITFTPGSNVAQLSVAANSASVANTAANTFLSKLNVGDFIEAGNSSIGKTQLKVTSIGVPVTSGNTATANIALAAPFTYASSFTSNTLNRSWEFASLFDRAPGVSAFQANSTNASTVDEVHIAIVDEDGLFTGVPNSVLETWPRLSRATDATTENGQSNYYRNVINTNSEYVYIAKDRANATSAVSGSLANSTNGVAYTASLINGADGASENTISLGKLAAGYDLYKNAEDVDVSIILQGKARGSSPDSESAVSSNSVTYSTLANYIVSNICEYRKDCIATISPAKVDSLVGDRATNVTQYFTNMNIGSSYFVGDSGYKYILDKYNDVYRWVPMNGDVAGTMVRTDQTRDPWYSPAGVERGQIKNVIKLAWNPNKAERDILYKAYINPIITLKGQGTVLYGDKTGIGRPSAFDRINVRRLLIVLEKAISTAAAGLLFEFNDTFTRNRFINIVEPFLRDVKGRRGLYDYKVVCDETNNTSQVIDSNGFVGDIFLKPSKSINYIQLNMTIVNSGVQFSEVVGSN
ncbi:tail sheath protein [Caulobacter phage Cr30]|uniref:tail sheath n=1 Tax=Caulobacter phage Cr30 TaxID=1357714 RepID=UPI0004A9BA83|nr:tail sheath [Caulobacter phage Cr30]AGS81072.1 tail sheath protein [Caulobacter phage Cr30]